MRALKGFGGLDAECRGEGGGAMRPVVEERTAPKPKPKVVNVPVFATLLVKRLSEDHHSGDVKLEATMIQRTLFADPLLIREAAGSSTPDDEASLLGFEMRVNDSLDKDTLIHVRKTMRGTLGDSAPGQTFCAVTASAELPLVLVPLVDCQPFGIRALELTLEYSSFVSQVPGGDIWLKSSVKPTIAHSGGLDCFDAGGRNFPCRPAANALTPLALAPCDTTHPLSHRTRPRRCETVSVFPARGRPEP